MSTFDGLWLKAESNYEPGHKGARSKLINHLGDEIMKVFAVCVLSRKAFRSITRASNRATPRRRTRRAPPKSNAGPVRADHGAVRQDECLGQMGRTRIETVTKLYGCILLRLYHISGQ